MKKKADNNQPATKQDVRVLKQDVGGLKRNVKALNRRIDSFEKEMKNEFSAHKIAIELKLDDQQEQNEVSRQEFYSKIYNLVDSVVQEIKTSQEERTILTDRVYDNVIRLDSHETRIKILEQQSPAAL